MPEDFEDEAIPVECFSYIPEWERELINRQLTNDRSQNSRYMGWEDWMRNDETGIYEQHLQKMEEPFYE